jgi:hypothetical protein
VRLITPHRTYLTITKTRKGRPRPRPGPGCRATDDDDDDAFTDYSAPSSEPFRLHSYKVPVIFV